MRQLGWASVIGITLLAVSTRAAGADFAFVHPGLLHTRQDLDRMKAAVAAKQEPIAAGYEVFRRHPCSQATYTMRGPFPEIGRNPTVHSGDFDQDAGAAYQCALMWCLTEDIAYANTSKAILNGWAATLKTVSGRDAILMAGLGPFKMVNAAELLRHTAAGWGAADVVQFERMLRTVIYPTLQDFALFANGNWDTAAVKTVLAIGVFCNDRTLFERALRYYVNGAGNGRLTHYIINDTGQCQESGRDMPHTQLGLAHLGDCCEIAWSQGLDLYASAGNRLLKGFEYTAEYNLGHEVPFTATLDRTGRYAHRAIARRGRFRPVFEQIAYHYVNRAGLAAPFTQQAAARVRPEGAAQGADHTGFGTLLYSRSPMDPAAAPVAVAPPSPPAAVIARGTREEVALTWVAPIGAAGYVVRHGAASGGPNTTIATDIKSPAFTDAGVTPGTLYRYVVSATNAAGESPPAVATTIGAGLPAPWTHDDVGPVAVAGSTSFDGHAFTLEGAGTDIGGASDQFQFAAVPLSGDGAITARFVAPVSSQSSRFGLMMRDGLSADAAHVSLLLTPAPARDDDRLGWKAELLTRAARGEHAIIAGESANLRAPHVVYGRFSQPYWLRLARAGNTFTGSISPDGQTWTSVAAATVALGNVVSVGLSVSSRLNQVTTSITFDHLTVPGL